MKNEDQPHVCNPFKDVPKCGARSKRTGQPCQQPAMANGRCRLHGGKSTGPPKGNKNALKHGHYTKKAIADRRYVRQLIKDSKELFDGV